jgi:DNA-binding transcriptional LysR family regulator
MNFNHLFIFHKVAKKRHFTRAAEELYISQPAVSKQMQELEKAVGQPLFSQVGRKIYLTEAGQRLSNYADQIFALAAEAEQMLEEMRELERGRLAVGASTTVGTYFLLDLLGRYQKRYPHIELFLDIANAEDIQERVLAHRVEIAIVEGDVFHNELFRRVWREDKLVLIASAHTSFIGTEQPASLQQLLDSNAPFLFRERGSGTRHVIEEALAARGFRAIHPLMELGSTEAIKQAVISDLGLAFVSEHTIHLEVAAGLVKCVPLNDFMLTRPLSVIYPKHRKLSKAAQAFLELLS